MLVDQCHIHDVLARVVRGLTSNPLLHEDLLQEAMIHLWQEESAHPGQSESWYLQNCRFYLINYLSSGRSLDSVKHWRGRCRLDADFDPSADIGDGLPNDESVFTNVCAHDIMELLWHRTASVDHSILRDLAEGFGIQEIAQRLNISHQAVSKRRRKIAVLAMQLGIALCNQTSSLKPSPIRS